MDATSLYTRLESDKSADIIREEIMKSDVEFENVDIEELGIYLRKNLPREYIIEKGYDNILPKQVKYNQRNDDNATNDIYEYIDDIERMFEEDEDLCEDEDVLSNEKPSKNDVMTSTETKIVTSSKKQLPEHMYYASAQALTISLITQTYCKMYIEHALHCTLYLKDQSSVS